MTQPEQTQDQPAPGGVQLLVAANVIPGANGAPTVVLMFGMGPTGYQVQVDWERVPALRELLNRNLDTAYEQAKRLASGLLVADAGQLPKLPDGRVNGAHFFPPNG